MYKLIRPLLFSIDPETVHDSAHSAGRIMSHPLFTWKLRLLYPRVSNEALQQKIFGIQFDNPVGLAAGFDKPGDIIDAMDAIGFGHTEVGAVTPELQIGNDRPRMFRLTQDKAAINRMGFNNAGLDVLVKNLKKRRSNIPVGVNIGKNKATPNEEAVNDYRKCMLLLPYVDYISVNVSSPNTPGLRELQDKGPLLEILNAVQEENREWAKKEGVEPKPVLLKIAPDMTNEQLNDVVAVVRESGADGIIATNTTSSRNGLKTDAAVVEAIGAGGVSGQPLKKRATEVVKYLYAAGNGEIPIVGVGGVATAEDAYDKIRAGASMVQVYTGMVYEGPSIARKINKGLLELLKRDGFAHISDAVGADHK